MNSAAFGRLIDDFCASEWQFHPVDASFTGAPGYDALLPPSDAGALARERIALSELSNRLEYAVVPDEAGARLDAKLMDAQIGHRLRQLDERPLQHNPSWATGEAAFAVISLLLREHAEAYPDLRARVGALPDFLAGAAGHLADRPLPPDWVTRAKTECGALQRLLDGLEPVDAKLRNRARRAIEAYAASLDDREAADPAAGEHYLAQLMKRVHGFTESPAQLEALAAAAFERVGEELDELAARIDPSLSWREQLARLGEIGPDAGDVLPSYRAWNARALNDASGLVTPATGYDLDYRPLPGWAEPIAGDLYFLPYRSPRAFDAGTGSSYWISQGEAGRTRQAHNTAAVKLIHAVHHGSIGHHTQNAAARRSSSKLARIAGTDCASAIAFLSAGTMVEGWACYAEDLMAEVPGFYTDAELLQLKYFELRNIGCCLGDIRLHTGVWSLEQMRAFYRDAAHFAPGRIWGETTRNSIFPGSRLMYWTGVERIKAMRAASTLETKAFHDRLLSFGSAPLAWISEELDACA
jgi:hypothetical protein